MSLMGGTAQATPVLVQTPVTESLLIRVPVLRLQSPSVTLSAVMRGMSASKATFWYGVLFSDPVNGLEKVIGVGWSVNLPVAARRLSELASQYAEAIRSRTEG